MDIITTAQEIRSKNAEIDRLRGCIKERSERKAVSIVEYYKAKLKAIMKLANSSEEFNIEGTIVKGPLNATLIKEVIKGVIWKELLEKEEAEALYKSVITNLEAVKATLNGLQSINKHQD